MDRTQSKLPKELILIVHGVGDPDPGETLSFFSQSLVTPDQALLEEQRVLWLNESRPQSGSSRFVSSFSAHVRDLEIRGETATATEVYWGDLSRVRRGLWGVILGLLQIVFGLRYVAYVGADQPGLGAAWLRRLGLHSSRLIHGPVLAVNFILALMTLTLIASQTLWEKSSINPWWADSLTTVIAISLLLIAGSVWRSTNNRVVERFWFWVFVGACSLLTLVFARSFLGIDHNHMHEETHSELACGLFFYCRILVVLLGMQYVWLSCTMVLLAVSWIMALLHPKTNRQGLHVGFLVPTLLVGVWSFAIPLVWVSCGEALKQFGEVERFDWLFHEAVPLLGLQCIMALMLTVTMVVVLTWYAIWRVRNGVDSYLLGKRSPRLILHPLVQFCTGMVALFGITISMMLNWNHFDGSSYEQFILGRFMVEANKYAAGILVPIAGMLFLSLKYLRPALDIGLDVVNHFYLKPADDDSAMDDDDEFDFSRVTHEHGSIVFTRREIIGGRLQRILEYYARQYDHRPILNILSHSQGTLIAAEVLNNSDLDWLPQKFSTVNLVTMGSPIHHLYQYYFPHVYPPVDQPYWSNLRSRIDSWTNIFRIDDFVGTEIPFPDSQRNAHGPRFSNHPIKVAGHHWYWVDKEVLGIVAEQNISPVISTAVKMCESDDANVHGPEIQFKRAA